MFKELYPERAMDFIKMRAETYSQCDPEVQDYWVEGRLDEFFEGFSVKDILERLKVPLLILQANPEMGMINHEDVEWVKSLMAELSHVFLEDTDHWLGLQDGREHLFLNAVNPFLELLR